MRWAAHALRVAFAHIATILLQLHAATTNTNIAEAKNETPRIVPTILFNAFFECYSNSAINTETIIDNLTIATDQTSIDISTSRRLIQAKQLTPTQSNPVIRLLHSFKSASIIIIWNLAPGSWWLGIVKIHPNWLYHTKSMSLTSTKFMTSQATLMSPECANIFSSYWGESKKHCIKAFVVSGITCAKCKGNYGSSVIVDEAEDHLVSSS